MLRIKLIIVVLLCISTCTAKAQTDMTENTESLTLTKNAKEDSSSLAAADHQERWTSWLYGMSLTDDAEQGWYEDMYEMLADLEENKQDINAVTREQLEQLPFLTDNQRMDIAQYIYRYGGISSWGELAMITSLDKLQRDLLPQFFFLGDGDEKEKPSLGTMLSHGKHEMMAHVGVPCYTRVGDESGDYLGYGVRHWLRYTFGWRNKIKAAFVASQDAGEPWFGTHNKMGYDYYSGYVMLRDMGRIKTAVLGRYRLRFGMGVALNNSFFFGKAAALASLMSSTNNLRGHSSRQEASYLQGLAATIALTKGLDLTAFVSHRRIDATLGHNDSTITTILATGYHRTESELQRKHNAAESMAGGHVAWNNGAWHAGATAYWWGFDKPLLPQRGKQHYRDIYATGKNFWNASIDYGYLSAKWSVDGETAIGDGGGVATLNRLSVVPTDRLQLLALQRFYSYRYHAIHARSYGENGDVQNESGVLIGATWRPRSAVTLSVFSDYAYFAWQRYRASESSCSWDNMVQAVLRLGSVTATARYRLHLRQQDNADGSALTNKWEHKGRLTVRYDQDRWSTQTIVNVGATLLDGASSRGFAVSQQADMSWRKITMSGSITYFDTDDYDCRFYVYERSPLYSFTFPMLYGNGMRYALLAKVALTARVAVTAKIGTTNYFDRDHIGSGLQQICRSSKTDLDFQVRVRL